MAKDKSRPSYKLEYDADLILGSRGGMSCGIWKDRGSIPRIKGTNLPDMSKAKLIKIESAGPGKEWHYYKYQPKTGDTYIDLDTDFLYVYDGQSWQPPWRHNITTEHIAENYVCECGADKCGSDKHSDWCPKY